MVINRVLRQACMTDRRGVARFSGAASNRATLIGGLVIFSRCFHVDDATFAVS